MESETAGSAGHFITAIWPCSGWVFSKLPQNRFSPLLSLSDFLQAFDHNHHPPPASEFTLATPLQGPAQGFSPHAHGGRCSWHVDRIVGLSLAWCVFSWNFFPGESSFTIFKSQECPFRASGPGACSGHLVATAFAHHTLLMEASL